MTKKTYDIVFDSDGWSTRSGGVLLGSFPSWLLAVGATRAAAEIDRRNGITPIVRYQDLKGTMHVLDIAAEASEPPTRQDPGALKNIDRLAHAPKQH